MTGFIVKFENIETGKKTKHLIEVDENLLDADSPKMHMFQLWGMVAKMASEMCGVGEELYSIKQIYS